MSNYYRDDEWIDDGTLEGEDACRELTYDLRMRDLPPRLGPAPSLSSMSFAQSRKMALTAFYAENVFSGYIHDAD